MPVTNGWRLELIGYVFVIVITCIDKDCRATLVKLNVSMVIVFLARSVHCPWPLTLGGMATVLTRESSRTRRNALKHGHLPNVAWLYT